MGEGHVHSGARWVHPPNRSPILQNSPIFGCFCSMGLHFGGMTAVPSWMCFVAGAWKSSAQPWGGAPVCGTELSRGVHVAYEAYPR